MSLAPITPGFPAPTELEIRIGVRKRALNAEIIENKQNSSRAGAAAAIDRAKARLSELAHISKLEVLDGWANVTPSARAKLVEWITK